MQNLTGLGQWRPTLVPVLKSWWTKLSLFSTGQGKSWARPLLTSRSFTQLPLPCLHPGSPAECPIAVCSLALSVWKLFLYCHGLWEKKSWVLALLKAAWLLLQSSMVQRHEEEQAKMEVFLIPASSCPFCSQYTEKCKIAAMWRGFPCSLGKVGG